MRNLKTPPRKTVGIENQELVYKLLEGGEKLTVSEIYEAISKTQEINERTIRRAITALTKSGFVKEFGRRGNATLYGKVDSSFAGSQTGEELIPLAGNLVNVEDFLRLFADLSVDPFRVKHAVVSNKATQLMRKILLYVVMTSGETGHGDGLKTASKSLYEYAEELRYTLSLIEGFLNSPVWFQQYRDRVAYEVRRVQEKDPELFQLATDVVRNG